MDLQTTWNDERRAVILQISWLVYSQSTRCLFVHESNETRVVSHVDDPLICAKPATLEKFWIQITKLVVVKRGEALNPRVPVVYLGFEY